jgi:hypothetical protein
MGAYQLFLLRDLEVLVLFKKNIIVIEQILRVKRSSKLTLHMI